MSIVASVRVITRIKFLITGLGNDLEFYDIKRVYTREQRSNGGAARAVVLIRP